MQDTHDEYEIWTSREEDSNLSWVRVAAIGFLPTLGVILLGSFL